MEYLEKGVLPQHTRKMLAIASNCTRLLVGGLCAGVAISAGPGPVVEPVEMFARTSEIPLINEERFVYISDCTMYGCAKGKPCIIDKLRMAMVGKGHDWPDWRAGRVPLHPGRLPVGMIAPLAK